MDFNEKQPSLLIGVTVFRSRDEDDDTIMKQMVLNFKKAEHRQILARTAWWAMHSGHEMVTWPLEDGEQVEQIDSRGLNRSSS